MNILMKMEKKTLKAIESRKIISQVVIGSHPRTKRPSINPTTSTNPTFGTIHELKYNEA
jgi:hypothetical protein